MMIFSGGKTICRIVAARCLCIALDFILPFSFLLFLGILFAAITSAHSHCDSFSSASFHVSLFSTNSNGFALAGFA